MRGGCSGVNGAAHVERMASAQRQTNLLSITDEPYYPNYFIRSTWKKSRSRLIDNSMILFSCRHAGHAEDFFPCKTTIYKILKTSLCFNIFVLQVVRKSSEQSATATSLTITPSLTLDTGNCISIIFRYPALFTEKQVPSRRVLQPSSF